LGLNLLLQPDARAYFRRSLPKYASAKTRAATTKKRMIHAFTPIPNGMSHVPAFVEGELARCLDREFIPSPPQPPFHIERTLGSANIV
jgi:hypothetical protein